MWANTAFKVLYSYRGTLCTCIGVVTHLTSLITAKTTSEHSINDPLCGRALLPTTSPHTKALWLHHRFPSRFPCRVYTHTRLHKGLPGDSPTSAAGLWSLTQWPLGNLPDIFRYLIFQIISVIDGWGISCELALRWMSLNLTDDKSTLVQVMAWCQQATSHYLSQCWPRSIYVSTCHVVAPLKSCVYH